MKAHQSHSSCFYPIFLLPSLPETKVPNACHSSVLLWSWEQGQHPQHTTISTESHGLNSRSGTAQPALTSVATQGSQAKREKLGGSGGFQDEGEQREQIKWKKAGDPPPKKNDRQGENRAGKSPSSWDIAPVGTEARTEVGTQPSGGLAVIQTMWVPL